jgi:hypothetical protein
VDIHRDDYVQIHCMVNAHDDHERSRGFRFACLAAKYQLPVAGCKVLQLPARLAKRLMASHSQHDRPSIPHSRGNAQSTAYGILCEDSDKDTCESKDFFLAFELDEKTVLEGATTGVAAKRAKSLRYSKPQSAGLRKAIRGKHSQVSGRHPQLPQRVYDSK